MTICDIPSQYQEEPPAKSIRKAVTTTEKETHRYDRKIQPSSHKPTLHAKKNPSTRRRRTP